MLALVNATTGGCLAGNFVHFGGSMVQDDLGDRQPMYFDGRTVLPGRALVTQRKKDLRQLFGLEEKSIIIREYKSALFESCYATTGTEADCRSNARLAPARPMISRPESSLEYLRYSKEYLNHVTFAPPRGGRLGGVGWPPRRVRTDGRVKLPGPRVRARHEPCTFEQQALFEDHS